MFLVCTGPYIIRVLQYRTAYYVLLWERKASAMGEGGAVPLEWVYVKCPYLSVYLRVGSVQVALAPRSD